MITNENIMSTETNNNVIMRRVFDKRHNLRGYLAAIREGNTVNIGWSFCCKKDHFSKDRGLQIAMNRAVNGTGNNVEIPRDVVNVLPEFYNQVARRFNDTNVELVVPWFPTNIEVVVPTKEISLENAILNFPQETTPAA